MPTSRFGTGQYEEPIIEAIKDGRMFRSFMSGTILAGATKKVLMLTPTTVNTIVVLRDVIIGASDSPLSTVTKAEIVVTDNGVLQPSFNFNLSSIRIAETKFYVDPVYTGGITFDVDLVTAGSQGGSNVATGAEISSRFPQIGPDNTAFSMELTNIGGTTATFILKAVWEEIP